MATSMRILVLLVWCVLATTANGDEKKTSDTAIDTDGTQNTTNIAGTEDKEVNITKIQLSEDVIEEYENDLFNAVAYRQYDRAVNITRMLHGSGYYNSVRTVINRLYDYRYTQVFDYAYKVTTTASWHIARDCFPYELRIHEDLVFAKIINYRYGMALKYADGEDLNRDTIAYGDPNTQTRFKITWKFIPVWINNMVYFKLRTINRNYFLKLGNSRDSDGDHGAYGSKNSDTDRHLWYVQPARYDGKVLFFIVNKEYNEMLKLGSQTDSDDDRKAYGHSKQNFFPEYFGWEIDVL